MFADLRKHFISVSDKAVSEDDLRQLVAIRALDVNFSHYLYDLSVFRSKRLKEYMDSLVKKYKTVDEVAVHVTHDELTHTLISVFITKDEKFDHISAIHEATKRYMDSMDVDTDAMTSVIAEEALDRAEDKEYIHSFEQLEEFIQLDENGELITDDDDSEEEEDDISTVIGLESKQVEVIKRTYNVFTLSDVIVDLSDFRVGDEGSEEINQAIAALHNPKEYYTVVYSINNKLIKTGIRIGYVPDTIDKIIDDVKSKVIY
jgi:hypothetical protein